jgi:hypothetical protein
MTNELLLLISIFPVLKKSGQRILPGKISSYFLFPESKFWHYFGIASFIFDIASLLKKGQNAIIDYFVEHI